MHNSISPLYFFAPNVYSIGIIIFFKKVSPNSHTDGNCKINRSEIDRPGKNQTNVIAESNPFSSLLWSG